MKTNDVIKIVGGVALVGVAGYAAYKLLGKEDKAKKQGVSFTGIALLDSSGIREVRAGQAITAKVSFKNIASTPIAPRFRLPIWESRGWPHTPIGDKSSDWQRTPVVQPGDTIEFDVVQVVPANWGEGLGVSVRLDMEGVGTVKNWDAYFTVGARLFRWPSDRADVFEWLHPEWDFPWVRAVWNIQHRGPAERVWWGFSIHPVKVNPNTGEQVFYIDPHNLTSYLGPDIWGGMWLDWGDDVDWTSWQGSREITMEFPRGYGPGLYAAMWVIQSESPIDRRNAGLPPLTDEFPAVFDHWNVLWIQ